MEFRDPNEEFFYNYQGKAAPEGEGPQAGFPVQDTVYNSQSPQDYRNRQKKRRRKKTLKRVLVLSVVAILLGSMAWLITSMALARQGGAVVQPGSSTPVGSVPSAVVSTPSSTFAPPSSVAPPASSTPAPLLPESRPVDNTSWNLSNPLQAVMDARVAEAPDKRMIALPQNGRIDRSYFDNVVFVGDSLTQGMQIYSQGLQNAKFCAYKGVSPKSIYDGSLVARTDGVREVPMDALVAHQPDNVYILLGTNAMVSMSNDILLAYYSEMLDVMKERLADGVSFYIQSITPVLQGVDPRFNFDDIAYLNDQLAKMAFEKGMYFLDLHEALAGDDGWLRTDYGATKDGYHLNPSGYAAWVEYLITHTAYNRRHAHLYQENPEPYQQLPPPE